jgi:hypothetical protein
MSNYNNVTPHTLEEFIEYGEASSEITYFDTSILAGENGIMYTIDNVVFDYLDEIKDTRLYVKLNASDYKKYRYDGVYMLAYDVYGCRDVAYLILALNGIWNPQDFTMNPIYMLRKQDMKALLEAIKNAESEYINYNREQVGML